MMLWDDQWRGSPRAQCFSSSPTPPLPVGHSAIIHMALLAQRSLSCFYLIIFVIQEHSTLKANN